MFTGKNIFSKEAGGQVNEKYSRNRADQEDKEPLAGEQFVHKDIFWCDDQNQETDKNQKFFHS